MENVEPRLRQMIVSDTKPWTDRMEPDGPEIVLPGLEVITLHGSTWPGFPVI